MENIRYFLENSRIALLDLINSRSILESKRKWVGRHCKQRDADQLEILIESVRSKIWNQQQAIAKLEFRTICGSRLRFRSNEASAKVFVPTSIDASAAIQMPRGRTTRSSVSSPIQMAHAADNVQGGKPLAPVLPLIDQTSPQAAGPA